jgi:hypothetical protein
MDGLFCWILQLKDHFARQVFLRALTDKEAATVAAELKDHFHLR